MLPRFIAKEAVNSFWFYDYDRQGWVTNDPIGQAALDQELARRAKTEEPLVHDEALSSEEIEALPDGVEKDYQLAMSEPTPTFLYTTNEPPIPITHVDLFVDAEPAPTPPEPTLRRRI